MPPTDGSGGVTQPAGGSYPATANTLIESAKFNIAIADIYTILALAIYRDGQSTTTQRIPFAQGISADTIAELTAAVGVTIDGVLLKDALVGIGYGGTGAATAQAAIDALSAVAAATNEYVLTKDTASGNATWKAATGANVLVQRKYAEYVTNADLTTAIPMDDSIPQSGEGTEIITLAITPTSTSNKIRMRFSCAGANSGANSWFIAALFRDAVADALVARAVLKELATAATEIYLEFEETAPSTSAITYKVRVGPNTGTLRLNGTDTARFMGGVQRATLILEEVTP